MSFLKGFIVLFLLLFLSACIDNQKPIQDNYPQTQVEEKPLVAEEAVSEVVDLSHFFLKDGSIASFVGEGNEYASYQTRTEWHNDHTVSIYEDNGGTRLIRTYRIEDDSIQLIQEEGEFYGEYDANDDELQRLTPLSTFLQLPLKKGILFDDWMIVSINQTIDTPFKTFHDVIMLEKKTESGSILRKYMVKGYGEVKREFIMDNTTDGFSVTSTIESIK